MGGGELRRDRRAGAGDRAGGAEPQQAGNPRARCDPGQQPVAQRGRVRIAAVEPADIAVVEPLRLASDVRLALTEPGAVPFRPPPNPPPSLASPQPRGTTDPSSAPTSPPPAPTA